MKKNNRPYTGRSAQFIGPDSEFVDFCEGLLVHPSPPAFYQVKKLGIRDFSLIQAIRPQAMCLLSSFCLNRWLQKQQGKFDPTALDDKLALEYWIENNVVTRLGYCSIKAEDSFLSELILAAAYNYLVIVRVENAVALKNFDANPILSRQIELCTQFALAQSLSGLAVVIPNPDYYDIFTAFGFEREIQADTGLPVTFVLKI
ncbi:hypothetical protein FKG94_14270 [Exilibacterium tricleocarpae]|uniref:Uncharacterized protein n=1 Tax=Exilibacterium tricleocarpae TaxID=2591008 RepID=A0A545TLX2_9GAMM|nr:hypothetical protein [Exilibacterium tricleocarpae]TQV78230.1 hypothetical protein FKG94_14270 [Exilibacterium tricleocarpae]